MNRKVYLLRHGAVAQHTPRRFLGQRDVPVSDIGLAQAACWRDALAGVEFAGAWCSALVRSRQTAEIVLAGRGVTLTPLAAFNEISLGAWEGLTVAQVRAAYPGQYEARGADIARYRPPGGESFEDVAGRSVQALAHLLGGLPADQPGDVLVVAHGGVNRALLCTLLEVPLRRLFSLGQDYACLNILGIDNGRTSLLALNLPPGEVAGTPG